MEKNLEEIKASKMQNNTNPGKSQFQQDLEAFFSDK